jgi:uncharacterized membrane-anchored protein YjiN (DUF445 family)
MASTSKPTSAEGVKQTGESLQESATNVVNEVQEVVGQAMDKAAQAVCDMKEAAEKKTTETTETTAAETKVASDGKIVKEESTIKQEVTKEEPVSQKTQKSFDRNSDRVMEDISQGVQDAKKQIAKAGESLTAQMEKGSEKMASK